LIRQLLEQKNADEIDTIKKKLTLQQMQTELGMEPMEFDRAGNWKANTKLLDAQAKAIEERIK
jgi:hypothetical protein